MMKSALAFPCAVLAAALPHGVAGADVPVDFAREVLPVLSA